jgi:predicted DNA-binding transcriptional regulator AlpA
VTDNNLKAKPAAEPESQPLLVPVDRVADLLSISTRTVRKLDCTERMPAPVRIGSRTLWRLAELEEWVIAGCPPRYRWEAQKADPASSGGGTKNSRARR